MSTKKNKHQLTEWSVTFSCFKMLTLLAESLLSFRPKNSSHVSAFVLQVFEIVSM